jgi:threonine/homoserine/homoserine lactone efflux protein
MLQSPGCCIFCLQGVLQWIIFRLLAKGILIGVSIAAPVGPIGLLVIRRTLADGRLRGLVSGMGAATADGLYGVVAALGLAAVSDVLIQHGGWMRLAGGVFLFYLGVRTFFDAPPVDGSPPQGGVPEEDPVVGLWGAYASTLGLTLTNPMTILAFAGILAGLGAEAAGGGLLLVAGVFSGSALWWLALSTGVGFVRRWLRPAALRWVNRISGAVIGGLGLLALLEAARMLLPGT